MAVVRPVVSMVWRLLVLGSDVFDRARVELHGTYTHERLRELAVYTLQPHSRTRAVLVAFVLVLPCFVALVAADALPLAPIESGLAGQTAGLWVRLAFGGGCMASAAFVTMVESVPALRMSSVGLWVIGPVIGIATLPPVYVLSRLVGFPLPFTLITNTPNWLALMVTATLGTWKDTLRANRKARDDLLHVLVTFSGLVSAVFAYTAFSYLFSTLSTTRQNVVSCLLPLVKIAFKNWVNAGLHHSPQIKPICSVFTLDLFHAMFVSSAMQQSLADSALLIVLGIDVLLVVLAVYEVHSVACRVRTAQHESFRLRRHTETDPSQRRRTQDAVNDGPIAYALHVLDTSELVQRRVGLSGRTLAALPAAGTAHSLVPHPRIVPIAVGPVDKPHDHASPGNVHQELTNVELVLKMLYITEFYVLTEYAEAIVALIYGAYLYTLSYLPNRVYYPQLALLSADELRDKAVRVLVYAALEMLSLVVFCVVLGRVGHFSPVRQLGFVLEKHGRFAQTLLVNWITFAVLSAVLHLGAARGYLHVQVS